MRLHRFYISAPITSETFDVTDRDLIDQWRNVFRYNVGSQVILFDGSGTDYLCMISSLRNLGATVSIVSQRKNKFMPKINLTVCLTVIKKDNFELAVQKMTEIGVREIIPVLCERSEKKNLNMARLRKIAIEASEQSGRGDVPKIMEIVSIEEVLKSDLPETKIVLNPEGKNWREFSIEDNMVVFIGPEGGFSENEMKLFKNYTIPNISLGSQILRAETAAISISSLLLL